MFLKKLSLFHFRNYDSVSLELNPNKNYFLGQNAQGKTNLLEAVYFLSRAKSFRPTENSSFIGFTHKPQTYPHSQVETTISAEVKYQNFDFHIKAHISREKKSFFINNKKANSLQLAQVLPVVLFSPESLSVIKESAEQRRSLIDEISVFVEPRQIKLYSEFNRCLKSRNKLLKEILKEGATQDRLRILDSLNQIYLILATHVTELRIKSLKSIWPDFKKAAEFIFLQEDLKLSAQYLISENDALEWDAEKIFNTLQIRLAELAPAEISSGYSLVGPHKHEIQFLLNNKDSRFYCSQGQQRALILALKIAQIVYHQKLHHKYPILLLDDVLSELDEVKRSQLMKFLGEISAQVLVTATELHANETLREAKETGKANFFFIKQGRFEKVLTHKDEVSL